MKYLTIRTVRTRNVFKIFSMLIATYVLLVVINHYISKEEQNKIVEESKEIIQEVVNPIQEIKAEDKIPNVLKRIRECESLNSHFCTDKLITAKLCLKSEKGQVLVNSTKDIGKYGINLKFHGATATELGLDLFNETDNEKFALWLFENKGTVDWYISQHCWNK